MPTKKSVSNSPSNDISGDVSSLPVKILASDDVQEMDIDSPAVITEVLPDTELSNSSEARFTADEIENIHSLDELNDLKSNDINEDFNVEIMDTSIANNSASEIQSRKDIETNDSAFCNEPEVCLTEFPESVVTVSSLSEINDSNSESIDLKGTKKVIIVSQANSSSPSSVLTTSMISQSTSNQQVHLVPLSQSSSGSIPIQILPGQGSNTTQYVLTSMPGSPNKAVLKSVASSSLNTSPIKQKSNRVVLNAENTSPIKQGIVLGKMVSSSKSPSKVTMIPVTASKSPQVQKFLPTLSVCNSGVSLIASTTATTASVRSGISVINSAGSPTIINASDLQRIVSNTSQQPGQVVSGLSPTKVIQVRGQVGSAPVIAKIGSTGLKQVSSLSGSTIQGNKLQFVRFVTSSSGGKTNATLVPVTALQTAANKVLTTVSVTSSVTTPASTVIRPIIKNSSSNQIRMAIPIAPAVQGQTGSSAMVQKVIIPSQNISGVTHIRPNVPVSNLNRLPPGSTLISGGSNSSNIVMVPAQYISQIQSASSKNAIAPKPIVPISPPVAEPNGSNVIALKPAHGKTADANAARPRKPCNCTKSQCLKLYCDCFANGEFCNNCNCNHCYNNLDHEEERQKAIKACLDRNPHAFHPKIGKGRGGDVERRHNKGCNCKRSGCFKNYCECYEAKILCTDMCKCVGCKNYEETVDRKSLMHLADAAEVRVQQQNDATNKLSNQIKDLPSRPLTISSTGEKLPFTLVTKDVTDITCQCLIAQAEEAEDNCFSKSETEKLILEEFGRCLQKIIDYAHKTKLTV